MTVTSRSGEGTRSLCDTPSSLHAGTTTRSRSYDGYILVAKGPDPHVWHAVIATCRYDDSVLIVVSDNGGMVSHGGSNAPLRGEKATLWEVR